jgi:hypothetical protein
MRTKNFSMKKAIFCGIGSIFCNLLTVVLLVSCAGGEWTEQPGASAVPDATEVQASENTVDEAEAPVSGVEMTFRFNRASTHAANQFAVWIEDENGALVKTLFVTDFTAAGRGYLRREDSVASWVKAADPETMDDEALDAISGATPRSGILEYRWDLTDQSGERVSSGIYVVKLEGTLYWSSRILYSARIDTEREEIGDVLVTRSEPENPENEDMLEEFSVVFG